MRYLGEVNPVVRRYAVTAVQVGAVTLVPATANDHGLGIFGCDDVYILEGAVGLFMEK